jgi:Family of unknown function (DUF5684)
VGAMFASGGAAAGGVIFLIYLVVIVFEIAAMWKVFVKGGHPGWAAIIPFYNYYILSKLVGRPGWWWILFCIPFVSFIIWIIVAIDLAKSFAKTTGFAVGLIFLGPIFIPILGFGPASYVGPAAAVGGGGGYPPPGGYQQPSQAYQAPPQGYAQPTQSYPQPQQPSGGDIPPPPPA